MNLKLSIHRGGAGAEVEIEEIELDDPAKLYAAAKPWIEFLERAVAGEPIPAVPPGPTGRPGAAPAGGGEARPDRGDPPRSGKQLLGWANKSGKYGDLMKLAKAWDLGKVVDWSRDDVSAAHRELTRDDPAPWGGGRS
jgi:hypothetical protein